VSAVRFVAILAQRDRYDAWWCAVALEALVPRHGRAWRAVCCICVDSLECSGVDVYAHRVNLETGHDTGCCSFCGACGRDVLVASVPDEVFAAPPAGFRKSRCRYADHGGILSQLLDLARQSMTLAAPVDSVLTTSIYDVQL